MVLEFGDGWLPDSLEGGVKYGFKLDIGVVTEIRRAESDRNSIPTLLFIYNNNMDLLTHWL